MYKFGEAGGMGRYVPFESLGICGGEFGELFATEQWSRAGRRLAWRRPVHLAPLSLSASVPSPPVMWRRERGSGDETSLAEGPSRAQRPFVLFRDGLRSPCDWFTRLSECCSLPDGQSRWLSDDCSSRRRTNCDGELRGLTRRCQFGGREKSSF